MSVRRHHYERAFEAHLAHRRIPYIAFEEARDALLPSHARLNYGTAPNAPTLKSFDFILYTPAGNLLLDVKGRKVARAGARLESWSTEDDVRSLAAWARLFGDGFSAALAFVYWADAPARDALFEEFFEHDRRWYTLRAVRIEEYARRMRARSPRWRTVDLAPDDFDRVARPLAECCSPLQPHGAPDGPSRGAVRIVWS